MLTAKVALASYLGLVVVATCALAGGRVALDAYLTPEGRLRSALELRDAQAGFAGITADVWSIEPEGAFRVARYLDERAVAPARQGVLSRDRLEELARVLAEQELLTLPPELGQAPPINAHQITLSFGDKSSTLWLMPGQDPREVLAAGGRDPEDPLVRFVAIMQATLHSTEPPAEEGAP